MELGALPCSGSVLKPNEVNNEMTKCVSYLRYSSAKQGALSFAYQRKAILKYCSERNLQPLKEFSDAGYSGRNTNRPGFQELIAEAKANPEWKMVLVYDLSRFSRNEEEASQYKALIRNLDIAVISVTEPCTEDDPGGVMEALLDKRNSQKSLQIGNASYEALKILSENCKHCGGKPPLGYDVDKKTGLLVVNEDEAQVVKTIFKMYDTGFSYSKIATYLNSIGTRTKVGNRFTKNSFHEILCQTKYIGTYSWNKHPGCGSSVGENSTEAQTIVENGCPAIISRELFDSVQRRMVANSRGNCDSKNQKHYMLSGLRILKCGCCGRYMVGKSYTSKGYKYVKYSCPDRKCANKPINTKEIDRCVANILLFNYFIKQDRGALNALINASKNPRLLKLYETKLRGLKVRRSNLIDLIVEEPSAEAKEKLKALSLEETNLMEKIAEQQDVLPPIPLTSDKVGMKKFCRLICNELISSDDVEIRAFIKSAIKEIVVDLDDVTVTLADSAF